MLKGFFAYYRPHRRLFLIDFGCAVLSGLLVLGFPLAVSLFVDRLLPQSDLPAHHQSDLPATAAGIRPPVVVGARCRIA
jgi:hypothetical protein